MSENTVKNIFLDENGETVRTANHLVLCEMITPEGEETYEYVPAGEVMHFSGATGSEVVAVCSMFEREKEIKADDFDEEVTEYVDEKTEDTSVIWSIPMTKLLIITYKDTKKDPKNKKILVKYFWRKVAAVIATHGHKVTSDQCDTKWKCLIRTYKRKLRKAKTTGEEADDGCDFFDDMHEIMFKKPEINPVALSSSLAGYSKYILQQTESNDEFPATDSNSNKISKRRSICDENKPKKQKVERKSKEPSWIKELREEKQKQHEANYEQKKKFTEIFENYVATLQTNKNRSGTKKKGQEDQD